MTATGQDFPGNTGHPGPSFLAPPGPGNLAVTPSPPTASTSQPPLSSDGATGPTKPVARRTGTALRRRAIGLAVGVAVLVLALVVWFLAVPALRGDTGGGTPGWSLILTDTEAGSSDLRYVDQADDSVSLISWASGDQALAQGVDIAKGQVLWAQLAAEVSGDPGNNSVYLTNDDYTYTQVIDAHSEADLIAGPGEWRIVYQDADVVVTRDINTLQLCGRRTADVNGCAWQAGGIDFGPVVFDGKWVNTTVGVLDVKTGLPASFGADARQCLAPSPPSTPGQETVFYAGSGDSVWRFESLPDDPWSCMTAYQVSTVDVDTGQMGLATLIDAPQSDTWPLSSLYTSIGDDGIAATLSVLPWGTWQPLWQAHLSGMITNVWEVGGVVIVRQLGVGEGPGVIDVPGLSVFNVTNGQQLWTGDLDYLGTKSNIVYLKSDDTVTAFDASSPDFAELWDVPVPDPKAEVHMAGRYVMAIDPDSGRIWRLDHA